jgi:hypothetical protein
MLAKLGSAGYPSLRGDAPAAAMIRLDCKPNDAVHSFNLVKEIGHLSDLKGLARELLETRLARWNPSKISSLLGVGGGEEAGRLGRLVHHYLEYECSLVQVAIYHPYGSKTRQEPQQEHRSRCVHLAPSAG